MSIRLLDILVTKQEKAEIYQFPAESLFTYLQDVFLSHEEMKFEYHYDREMLWAEADLLKTVLINLLDNACKASEPGSTIQVTGKKEKEGYRFTVRDYGVGIPKEEQEKITKAFYMVDKSRSRSKNGAGLGLALCAQILKLHESRLEIESTPGEGTAMSFVLPEQNKKG